jgi:hypothetical protein
LKTQRGSLATKNILIDHSDKLNVCKGFRECKFVSCLSYSIEFILFFDTVLISKNIKNVSIRNLNIQVDTEIKFSVLATSYLHQLIKAFSNISFKCNCFAPLPRDATNFKNGYHLIKSYSALHSTNTNTQTAVQRAFCTQLYMKPNRTVDFCGPLWKQARTEPADATKFSVCPPFLIDQVF